MCALLCMWCTETEQSIYDLRDFKSMFIDSSRWFKISGLPDTLIPNEIYWNQSHLYFSRKSIVIWAKMLSLVKPEIERLLAIVANNYYFMFELNERIEGIQQRSQKYMWAKWQSVKHWFWQRVLWLPHKDWSVFIEFEEDQNSEICLKNPFENQSS